HPDRSIRHLQRGPRQDGLSDRPGSSLRKPDADHLGPALQLLAADVGVAGAADEGRPSRQRPGPPQRELLRAHPELPPRLLAAALSVRGIPRGLPLLRRGPRPPAPAARRTQLLPAPRDIAADGPARLPERCAVEPWRELQLPA